MRHIIETTGVFDGGFFVMHYDDDDLYSNRFLGRESIFKYVRSLIRYNDIVPYPRTFIKVDDDVIWMQADGFCDYWLKKELEHTLRN